MILFIRPEHHFFTLHMQALCSMEGPLQLANDDHGSRGNQVSWISLTILSFLRDPLSSVFKIFFFTPFSFFLFKYLIV